MVLWVLSFRKVYPFPLWYVSVARAGHFWSNAFIYVFHHIHEFLMFFIWKIMRDITLVSNVNKCRCRRR